MSPSERVKNSPSQEPSGTSYPPDFSYYFQAYQRLGLNLGNDLNKWAEESRAVLFRRGLIYREQGPEEERWLTLKAAFCPDTISAGVICNEEQLSAMEKVFEDGLRKYPELAPMIAIFRKQIGTTGKLH